MKIRIVILNVFVVALLFSNCSKLKEEYAGNSIPDEEIISPENLLFKTQVPKKDYDIIAVKPTQHSVSLSILSYKTCAAIIEYSIRGSVNFKTLNFSLTANEPKEILLSDLLPSQSYDYYYSCKLPGSNTYIKSVKYAFCTAINTDASFIMAITADSHLDTHTDTAIYKKTLLNVKEENPDFMIELGDTFMNDKYGQDFSMVLYNYLAQRYFFGGICHSIPLFFVQGNHDGECGYYNNGSSLSWAAWSNRMRKKYFPMPEPDAFYKGNSINDSYTGMLQNYYAWQWSNALFIVLDPFWYSPLSATKVPWDRTLGIQQYNWLKNVLATSTARFKFVFIHNLVGGMDLEGLARGGVEAAHLYEWGGENGSGLYEFNTRRRGWDMPIHNLLVKYGVDIVFHGHDHFYDYQTLDGVVYQEVPQPGAPENAAPIQALTYGYQQGTILGATGFLKLSINSNSASIAYMATSVANSGQNKKILHQYLIN